MTASILRFTRPPASAREELMETFLPASAWECPDQQSRRDLIGLTHTFPTGPDHATMAAANPQDWPLEAMLAGMETAGLQDDAGAMRNKVLPNTRVMALWAHPERRVLCPDGVLLFRLVADLNSDSELCAVTVFLDHCWLTPELRGQKYSHYFACYFRAFVFYHPIHPWHGPGAEGSVAKEGIGIRLVTANGGAAWHIVSHNIASIFSMNSSMWRNDLERGSRLVTPYNARWAVRQLQLDFPFEVQRNDLAR